jgi:putative SOS response-associated peptidase YedK
VRLREERLEGEMMTWAWLQGKKPVFNFVSEGRDFSKNERVLILATSFYEYTAPQPQKPKIKLQDQHQFTLKGQDCMRPTWRSNWHITITVQATM